MIIKPQQTKNKRQEVVSIPGFIGEAYRDILLWSQPGIIYEINSTKPVPVKYISVGALGVILSSYKIPEKVAEIHMIYLVTEEIAQVFTESRNTLVIRVLFNPGPVLVILDITVLLVVPHTREDCLISRVINRYCSLPVIPDNIFTSFVITFINGVSILPVSNRGIVILAI